jgi:AP2-like factor (euAP2 lineage)
MFVSAAWDGELDLELSLGCAGSDLSTVAVEACSSAPSRQRTMTLTVKTKIPR